MLTTIAAIDGNEEKCVQDWSVEFVLVSEWPRYKFCIIIDCSLKAVQWRAGWFSAKTLIDAPFEGRYRRTRPLR